MVLKLTEGSPKAPKDRWSILYHKEVEKNLTLNDNTAPLASQYCARVVGGHLNERIAYMKKVAEEEDLKIADVRIMFAKRECAARAMDIVVAEINEDGFLVADEILDELDDVVGDDDEVINWDDQYDRSEHTERSELQEQQYMRSMAKSLHKQLEEGKLKEVFDPETRTHQIHTLDGAFVGYSYELQFNRHWPDGVLND